MLIAFFVNMWCKVVVFCCIVAVALGALAHEALPPKPEKFKDLEGCYIAELDEVVPFGATAPSRKFCKQYRCSAGSITHESCGAVAAPPGVKLVEDKSKPYPECCPRFP